MRYGIWQNYLCDYVLSFFGKREISYLFNINKYYKGEDTPRHIPVEIRLSTVFYKCIICMFLDFRQIFKTPGKSISRADIFTDLVGKNFFQPERFLNETNHDD